MGVSSTTRLPTLSAQSVPALFNYLQITANAKVVARWSVTIRSFRAAWPQEGETTRFRTMWQVMLSDHPGLVFVLIEDSGKMSRAKVWKDWQGRKKKWSEEKSRAKEQDMQVDEEPPKLQAPSHTRYTLSVLSSSLPTLLSKLNLPAPHGAPLGTSGPGAWTPRGAAVCIEGLTLSLNSPSEDTLSNTDWLVRVGSVVAGGGRSAGAVVEAEYLPISNLLPSSPFMQTFLASLFPQHLVAEQSAVVVSDQMWEEVVPRSSGEWEKRILERTHKKGKKEKDKSVAGSEESEGAQGSDDEDLPLGAALSNKKDEGIKLPFQGLKRGAEQPQHDAWTGVERGRRVAFSYIQMLRAEGII